MSRLKGTKLKISRDTILFIIGALGLFYETVLYHGAGERPTLIMAFLALMGIPLFLRADENKKDNSNGRNGKN